MVWIGNGVKMTIRQFAQRLKAPHWPNLNLWGRGLLFKQSNRSSKWRSSNANDLASDIIALLPNCATEVWCIAALRNLHWPQNHVWRPLEQRSNAVVVSEVDFVIIPPRISEVDTDGISDCQQGTVIRSNTLGLDFPICHVYPVPSIVNVQKGLNLYCCWNLLGKTIVIALPFYGKVAVYIVIPAMRG